DRQRRPELEDPHLLCGQAIQLRDDIGVDDLPLANGFEGVGIPEEQVDGQRERTRVLAACGDEDVLELRRHQPISSYSMRKVSSGWSTSIAWWTLNLKTSPMSKTERGNGSATVVPPRHPG